MVVNIPQLNRPFVDNPQNGHEYCIKNNLSIGDREALVTLSGDTGFSWIDFSALIFQMTKDKGEVFNHIYNNKFIMLPKGALPFDEETNKLPPLMALSEGKFVSVNKLVIDTDRHECEIEGTEIYYNARIINKELESKLQDHLQVEVVAGDFPVFEESYLSYRQIKEIYDQFIKYNDEDNLKLQESRSKNLCFIRAHLVSLILNRLRIPHTKVFKYVCATEWCRHSKKKWSYHTAVMTNDNKGNHWVWDPWDELSGRLLSLREWMKREDEIEPVRLMFANRAIVSDFKDGVTPEADQFMQISTKKEINAFQALCVSAIPNPPESPLSISEEIKIKNLVLRVLMTCGYYAKGSLPEVDQFLQISTKKEVDEFQAMLTSAIPNLPKPPLSISEEIKIKNLFLRMIMTSSYDASPPERPFS